MGTYIYGAIYTIIYTVMCSLFASVLLQKTRIPNNNKYNLYIISWIVAEYCASAMFDRYVIIKMITVIFFNAFFLKIIYKAEVLQTFGAAFFYQAVCALTDYLVFIIARKILGGINLVDSTDTVTGYLIGTLSQIIVIILVIWLRNEFALEKEYIMTKQEWIKFLVFPVFSMMTILAFAVNFDVNMTQKQENTILFVVFGLMFMNIFVFYLIMDIIKRETKRKQEEMLQKHAEQTEKLYRQERKQYEELQRQRHEYKNQMLVIQTLLEKKDYSRIEGYIQDYCGKTEKEDWFDTNHSVVNAVLNLKYREALSKNILMIVRFNDLSDIPLKDADLIVVLSNLLDNAIEASERCKKETPLIKVKFIVENEKMLLAVNNIWNGKIKLHKGRIVSAKRDGNKHGYGMKNVESIVNNYKGTFIIDREDKEFKVVVRIPIL